jgi:hypothetical protein
LWINSSALLLSSFSLAITNAGRAHRNLHDRYHSSYFGGLSRSMRDLGSQSEASLLKEIYRSDPERVIQIFESQPSLHSNSSALSEYVKALVKVDRLDDSTLLKTLQRGTNILKISYLWFVQLVSLIQLLCVETCCCF